jgi:predicted transposase/invertase (TIGR01784 family)
MFKKVVIVSIVNFKMNNLQNYKHYYKIINTEDLNDTLTEKIEIIIIELKKFKKIIKDFNNKEHLYLSFFDKMTSHNDRKEMGKMDEGLKAAVKRIEEAIQSEEELRIYHKIQLENAISEKEKNRAEKKLKEEIEKGREEGIEKGEKTARIKYAKKLKDMGMAIEQISEIIELPIEKIIEL